MHRGNMTCGIYKTGTVETALRACSSSALENVSKSTPRISTHQNDLGQWGPKGDPMAVEPLLCSSNCSTILPSRSYCWLDVAFVSILHVRAMRELTFCKGADVSVPWLQRTPSLAEKAFDSLFNTTGNSRGDHTHSFTEGLDVVDKIFEPTPRVVTKISWSSLNPVASNER